MKSSQLRKQLFADLREVLKAQANTLNAESVQTSHPDTDELASFFTGKSNQPKTAAHVAACQRCVEDIALYAKAEQAAADFKPHKRRAGKVPAAAWQMIRDWQNNSLAKPKMQSERVSAEMLITFARLLANRQEFKTGRKAVTKAAPNQVPVIVLNREGEFRGIELFEKSESKGGEITLKYPDQAGRFDKHELYALLRQGQTQYEVESFPIERNRVRVKRLANQDSAHARAEYFIIED